MIAEPLLAAVHARLAAALAAPTGDYVPLRIGSHVIGWLDDERATRLARFGDVFVRASDGLHFARRLQDEATRTRALEDVTRALASQGQLSAWRDEAYAVAGAFGHAPLCRIERAAARYFGIVTFAAHLNGLVDCNPTNMWIARRSATKAIDPGQLDNLVGGGIRAGTSVTDTVVREAWEEAGIPDTLARHSVATGIVRICRAQPEGLQREIVFVHDLSLPHDYAPRCMDGEAVEHRLVSLTEAARLTAQHEGEDMMTADASLVVLDCLLRRGFISPDSPHFLPLAQLRWAGLNLHGS